MVKEIIHDPILLAQKSKIATKEDIPVADNLIDTLKANSERCVGMAANMIGSAKRIIVFSDNGKIGEMFNPEIISGKDAFETEEGCLSLFQVYAKPSDTKQLKSSGRTVIFSTELKILQAGQHRLFSTKLTTATVFLYNWK